MHVVDIFAACSVLNQSVGDADLFTLRVYENEEKARSGEGKLQRCRKFVAIGSNSTHVVVVPKKDDIARSIAEGFAKACRKSVRESHCVATIALIKQAK